MDCVVNEPDPFCQPFFDKFADLWSPSVVRIRRDPRSSVSTVVRLCLCESALSADHAKSSRDRSALSGHRFRRKRVQCTGDRTAGTTEITKPPSSRKGGTSAPRGHEEP